MAELHKANAAKQSEAQQVALSSEMQAKEELRLALERQQQQAQNDQEALVTQVIIFHLMHGAILFLLSTAREIIHLVASICLSVCSFVCALTTELFNLRP